jgi:lysophospholipid acyltransferase (LPLAT)-like uncharacterized protein
MLKKLKRFVSGRILPFLAVKVGQRLLHLLLWTCKWKIEGLEYFKETAKNEKCILMLWHNRLALAPFILTRFAPEFIYAAFISNSRDGELISAIVHSYKNGRTIRVPHNARHEALRELIMHLKEKKDVIVITPDGPRGPLYKLKQGAALAALETSAQTVSLNWSAKKYWEFGSWDKLRIPKPFTTIRVHFEKSIILNPLINRVEAQKILQDYMNESNSNLSFL